VRSWLITWSCNARRDPFGGDANCIQVETVSGTGLSRENSTFTDFHDYAIAHRPPLRQFQAEVYPRLPSNQGPGRVQRDLLRSPAPTATSGATSCVLWSCSSFDSSRYIVKYGYIIVGNESFICLQSRHEPPYLPFVEVWRITKS